MVVGELFRFEIFGQRGSRPTAVRQTEYQYLWVLGVVCPETGHAEGLLSPQLNTKIVNEFLTQFATTIPADEHAVMLWDGAGFHASKQLRVPENVTVVTLPAYSPELNPIENLWHYLKSHFWSNRAYDDDDALEEAAVAAWGAPGTGPRGNGRKVLGRLAKSANELGELLGRDHDLAVLGCKLVETQNSELPVMTPIERIIDQERNAL